MGRDGGRVGGWGDSLEDRERDGEIERGSDGERVGET